VCVGVCGGVGGCVCVWHGLGTCMSDGEQTSSTVGEVMVRLCITCVRACTRRKLLKSTTSSESDWLRRHVKAGSDISELDIVFLTAVRGMCNAGHGYGMACAVRQSDADGGARTSL
jgi:hypothetical protein